MARSNSMTSAGQCRLAPLIPCIQDASKLYDYCVKIMFKLHLALPPDTLTGHRERFLAQFKSLRKFYESTSNMQYFKDLIAIPPLPEVTEIEEGLVKAISIFELTESRSGVNYETVAGDVSNVKNRPLFLEEANIVDRDNAIEQPNIVERVENVAGRDDDLKGNKFFLRQNIINNNNDPEVADLLGLWKN